MAKGRHIYLNTRFTTVYADIWCIYCMKLEIKALNIFLNNLNKIPHGFV